MQECFAVSRLLHLHSDVQEGFTVAEQFMEAQRGHTLATLLGTVPSTLVSCADFGLFLLKFSEMKWLYLFEICMHMNMLPNSNGKDSITCCHVTQF